ncbi:hypothetical protein JOQ06_023880, partial [Pogonophryne albipinna]
VLMGIFQVGFVSVYLSDSLLRWLCYRSVSDHPHLPVQIPSGSEDPSSSGLVHSLPNVVVEAANTTTFNCHMNYTNQTQVLVPSFDSRLYMLCFLPAIVLLVFVPDLKYLAPLSLVANILMTASLILIYFYPLTNIQYPIDLPKVGRLKDYPLFFGTAIFAFEGIGVVLPLENKMNRPQSFIPVLYLGMGIVTFLYITLGTIGYLCFGDTIGGSITLNLPNCWTYQGVKLLYSFGIFITFALQFYVPAEILIPPVLARVSVRWERPVDMLLRTVLVLFTLARRY